MIVEQFEFSYTCEDGRRKYRVLKRQPLRY